VIDLYHQFFNDAMGWDPDDEVRGPYPWRQADDEAAAHQLLL